MDARTYFMEISALATQIEHEILDRVIDGMDSDRATSEAMDTLHEIIDGHEYVIYTYKAIHVALHSSNEDAYVDAIGDDLDTSSFSSLICQVAFFAMLQDVTESVRSWDDLREQYLEKAIAMSLSSSLGQYTGDRLAELLSPALYAEIQAARANDSENLGDLLAEAHDLPRVAVCDDDVFILVEGQDVGAFCAVFEAY